MALRITTWNVNGIKNPFGYHPWSTNRTYQYMFDLLEADIVCFQELKIQKKDLTDDMVLVPGWDPYFTFPKHKKGYSGVAIYTRSEKCQAVKAEEGITGILESRSHNGRSYISLPASESIGGYPELSKEDALLLDSEGRALVLDLGAFILIGTYCPVSADSSRDSFRIAFVNAVFERVTRLIKECNRSVVLVGDLNIARDEIDTAGAREMMKDLGISDWKDTPTRGALHRLLHPHPDGLMRDLCREFFPDRRGMYTCWDTKKNKRPGNAGSRIDYVLCSTDMRSWFSSANIQEGLMGSDHCPVYAVLNDTVERDSKQQHILDIVNPNGAYNNGKKQPDRNYVQPPLCMKQFSEFRQRRSLKDMFSKMNATPSSSNINSFNVTAKRPLSEESTSDAQIRVKKTARASKPQGVKRAQTSPSQQSLRGFFKAKSIESLPASQEASEGFPLDTDGATQGSRGSNASPGAPPPKDAEPFINPIESKEKWDKIFTPKPPPLCTGHQEVCIKLVTKKPGPNQGRAFWMCRRPIGPDGEAAMRSGGNEWRCNFFKWANEA